MPDRKTIPAVTVPSAGFELLDNFAHSKKMSMSELIRFICQNSPDVREFAGADDLSDLFEVDGWGGKRTRQQSDA